LFEITHSKERHNKNPILVADIMRNDAADEPSYSFSALQISKPTTSKEPVEITHNTVGHMENTQVAVQVVQEYILVGQDCIMVTGGTGYLSMRHCGRGRRLTRWRQWRSCPEPSPLTTPHGGGGGVHTSAQDA
jgi:hypothetical protein